MKNAESPRDFVATDVWRPSVPVTFTVDELLYLHSRIRIDCPGIEQWRYPPCSKDLNDQIVEAYVSCVESELRDYTLILNYWDMAAIDSTVSWSDKSAGGTKLGEPVLMKVFRARRKLAGDIEATGKEGVAQHTFDELTEKLKEKP